MCCHCRIKTVSISMCFYSGKPFMSFFWGRFRMNRPTEMMLMYLKCVTLTYIKWFSSPINVPIKRYEDLLWQRQYAKVADNEWEASGRMTMLSWSYLLWICFYSSTTLVLLTSFFKRCAFVYVATALSLLSLQPLGNGKTLWECLICCFFNLWKKPYFVVIIFY